MAQTYISQVKFKHTGNPMKILRGYGVSYLKGQAFANTNKVVYLKGMDLANDSHTAFMQGITRSSSYAYMRGCVNVNSSSDAFLKSTGIGTSLIYAYIEGWSASASTDSSRTAYLKGTGQELLPISDIAINSWINETSGSTLFSSLADNDDGTYIWKDNAQIGDYFEVLLDAPTPLAAGNYYLRFRIYRKDGTVQANLKVELRQGNTVIADDTQTTTNGVLEYSHQLTADEIADITDWDDLRIRVTMMGIT